MGCDGPFISTCLIFFFSPKHQLLRLYNCFLCVCLISNFFSQIFFYLIRYLDSYRATSHKNSVTEFVLFVFIKSKEQLSFFVRLFRPLCFSSIVYLYNVLFMEDLYMEHF